MQPTAARRRERQIQQGAWGTAGIARVFQQCLYENSPQMIEKEQWPRNNYPNLNGMEISCLRSYEDILKPASEAQDSF